ncbi:hypothetical protein O1M63_12000 [Streptomyces mirabilis]|nr:hypothetical protein [Streptomyces mirabilis]
MAKTTTRSRGSGAGAGSGTRHTMTAAARAAAKRAERGHLEPDPASTDEVALTARGTGRRPHRAHRGP